MNPGKRITLREIAAEAGVSRATASRALRNDPSQSAETRARIRAIAQRVGYSVHPLVSTVMSGLRKARSERLTGNLAYLTAWPTRNGWKAVPTYAKYFQGAAQRARQLGYQLDEFWLREPGMSGRRMSNILETRGIQGLVIAPLPIPPSRGHLSLTWPRFAAVALGYSLWRPHFDRVVVHHAHCISLALRHLRRLRYERIGLALPAGLDERTDNNLTAAFLLYQQNIASVNRIPFFSIRKPDPREFANWFRKHHPDVVVSCGPPTLQWMRQLRLPIPQKVGFVELDLAEADGACAGIEQPCESIGATAIDLLVAQLQRNERGVPSQPKLVQLEGRWVPGATTRRDNRRAS